MKILVIGGIKSGKSRFAEEVALKAAKQKPYYLATNEFLDAEMKKRIQRHKKQRKKRFKTIEEPLRLTKRIKKLDDVVLIEDMSMWLNNMLYHKKSSKRIFKELQKLLELSNDMVFVMNNVSESVIGTSKLTRRFVDLNGVVSQRIAQRSDEVYEVVAGIAKRLK